MKNYVILKVFTKYGTAGTIVLVALALCATIVAHNAGAVSWPGAAVAAAAILVGGFLLLVLVDLTRVIQDMLIPQ